MSSGPVVNLALSSAELAACLQTLPSLDTPRLRLRRLRLADAPAIFAYASDPEIGKHTAWSPHNSVLDSETYLIEALKLYDGGNEALWGIEHRQDGPVIGTCGLYDIEPAHGTAAIGYVLSRQYRGQGLVPEAMEAVLMFAFQTLRLDRIQGICRVDNAPSSRVMEKLGLQREGILRHYRVVKGRRIDMAIYSIVRDDRAACPYLLAAVGE